jgi:hypothetical protein
MKPYKSSSDKENCSPVSSNCVIWQGPDISCINLCKGDSVSDIVYKLGVQLCDFQNTASLSDLQLDCLLDICTSSAKPELTLAAVLQLIIDKICCSFGTLNAAITNINLTGKGSGGSYDEPILDLPVCLQYVDPTTGLTVTSLTLSAYVVNIANQFCDLKTTVDLHTTQISNLDIRVTDLEDAPCCYVAPTIIPNCSYGSIIAGVPAEMNVLLDNLDDQYCQLRAILGTNTQLTSATSSQCLNLGGLNALSQPGTMSSISGWNNTVSSFAQSMQNMWLTVCDMRGVINDLKNCCGASNCSSFFLGFTVGTTTETDIFLLFNSLTVIPAGYSNCPTLSSVTINDGNGHLYTSTFDLVAASTNPSGVNFDISASGLDTALPWTIVVTGCIVNSAGTCTKIVTNVIPAPTPTTTTTTVLPCSNYTIYIEASDILAAIDNTNPAQNGKVYMVYVPCGSTSTINTFYSTSGSQGTICVNPIYVPYFYYMAADMLSTAASEATLSGTCTFAP